ncbi:MAG: phytoene/squalene synthase family protein [Hyphomicrobiaceae bacterium]
MSVPEHTIRAISADLRDAAMTMEQDRYLAATLARPEHQFALAAVAAFAAELQRIPATVSEPMMGSIRLQWWRDAIDAGTGGAASGHPVADALLSVLADHRLGRELALAMVEAREHDLAGALHSDDESLLAYLDATSANAFRLALTITGAQADDPDPLARAAGRAYGLARSLGRLPMLLHNGGLPLTADRIRSEGADPDRLGTSPVPADVALAVSRASAKLADLARVHFDEARLHFRALPKASRPALLPLAMVEPYLRLQKAGAQIDVAAEPSALSRVTRIGLAHLTGRI